MYIIWNCCWIFNYICSRSIRKNIFISFLFCFKQCQHKWFGIKCCPICCLYRNRFFYVKWCETNGFPALKILNLHYTGTIRFNQNNVNNKGLYYYLLAAITTVKNNNNFVYKICTWDMINISVEVEMRFAKHKITIWHSITVSYEVLSDALHLESTVTHYVTSFDFQLGLFDLKRVFL